MSLLIPALHHRYPDNDHFVLDTPEFRISDRTYACVIGTNGSGKSSFGSALSRLANKENWFYVPQYLERFLYAGNLEEQLNELFGYRLDRSRIAYLLEELGFSQPEEIMRFPFILLSGGERRRIALACALYVEPAYLILDEPDIGVSQKESMVILRKLNNLRAKDQTLMLITHSPAFVRGASDLICLKTGKLDRVGESQELLADPKFDIKEYGVRSYKDGF
jgi:energy-coupling factor transporter ATP-binding protein EcfA2